MIGAGEVAPLMLTGVVKLAPSMPLDGSFPFLHLDRKSEGGWSLLALIFTGIVLFILLSGSIWVMYHMNENMMPVDPAVMRNMP